MERRRIKTTNFRHKPPAGAVPLDRAITVTQLGEELPETAMMHSPVDNDNWVEPVMEGVSQGGQTPPTKYRHAYDKIARNLRLLGYSVVDIAEIFGVAKQTLTLWRNANPSFDDAWREGGPIADAKVARSMYKNAVGYVHEEVKIFNGVSGVVYAPYTKIVYPDTNAQKFWLSNRQPDYWKNLTAQQISGPDGGELALLPPSVNVIVVNSPNKKEQTTIEGESVS